MSSPAEENARCRKCRTLLSLGADKDICPKCVLEAALAAPQESDLETTLGAEPSIPTSSFTLSRIRYFGDYELLEEVARGGMGVVFKARQVSLNRIVAVKLITAGALATDELVKRFKAEAEAAASLSHPNIVPIYEIGQHQGHYYFSMGLIDGPNLDRHLTQSRKVDRPGKEEGETAQRKLSFSSLEPKAAANVLLTLARAVQHAHQHGVLHRDIKPGNILVDKEGTPFLTDFGLAKIAQNESTLTHTNAILGTPSYMAPEQARGDTRQVTTAADVYGLGAVLYTCLTGRPPFGGGTSYETIRQVLELEPTPPSVFQKGLDRDLETICLKCLRKHPGERYSSAEALGDDLQRWLRTEPIQARPISKVERLEKWVRRRPAIAALAGSLSLAVLVGVAAVTREWRRAEENAKELKESLYAGDMTRAFQAVELGRTQSARDLLKKHRPTGPEDRRGFEWRYLWGVARPQERFKLQAGGSVWGSAVDPSNRLLAAARDDGVIELWDIAKRARVNSFKTVLGIAYAAAFSPDGRFVASTLAADIPENPIYVWDVQTGALAKSLLGHSNMTSSVQFSPDGKRLVSGGTWSYNPKDPGELFVWDVETGTKLRELTDRKTSVGWFSSFSPDGKQFASAHGDGKVRIWQVETGALLQSLDAGKHHLLAASFGPDGQSVAAGDIEGVVRYWRLSDPEHARILGQLGGAVAYLAFSPDGRQLAVSGVDVVAKIWNLETPDKPYSLTGHAERIWSIHFVEDGKTVVTTSTDMTICFWPNPALQSEKPAPLPKGDGYSFSSDSRQVLYRTDGNLRIWDRQLKNDAVPIPGFPAQAETNWQGYAFRPNTQEFVTVGERGGIHLWLATNGVPVHATALPGETDLHGQPLISPDGKWLVLERGTNQLAIWKFEKEKPAMLLLHQESHISGSAFSPDSKHFRIVGLTGQLHSWSTSTWSREPSVFVGLSESMERDKSFRAAAFSRDGHWLAIGIPGTQSVRLMNLATGSSDLLTSNSGWVSSLAFSADGTTLAVGTLNGEIKLWRVSSKLEITSIKAHYTVVDSVSFSPDNQLLISAGVPETRIWFAPPFTETDRNPDAL